MLGKLLKVGLFNAGSLGTRHEEFVVAIEKSAVDIMAINETWLRSGEDGKAPVVDGYRLRHKPRPAAVRGGRGGGVGFYIKRGINVRACPHPPAASVEQMWLSVKVKSQLVIVGTAYRPPWLDVNVFLDALTQSVASFASYDYIALFGDFNINLLSPLDNKTKLLQIFLNSFNLTQLVQDPTHFTQHSQTLIDLVCTDMKARSVTVKHIPELGNHAIISVEFCIRAEKLKPHFIKYRPLTNIILELFNKDLRQIDWQCFDHLDNVNDMVKYYNTHILEIFNIHSPKKTLYIKSNSYPWITDTVRDMMYIRDSYHKQYFLSKSDSHKQSYKEMKHVVINAMHQEKKVYLNSHINQNISNPKKLWKNLKSTILPNSKNNFEIPSFCNNPNVINSHFLNVPGNDYVPISNLTYFEYHRFNASEFQLKAVSEDIVANIIRGLSSNAEGIDQITLQMITLTLPDTLSFITKLVNLSITSSTFPDLWKVSLIKPIPKKPNITSIKDLRPISILPCLSKILEKIVCYQMIKYLEAEGILPQVQSGFRKKHSTATALLDVVDNILAAQDRGMGTVLVLLDFSRAFDSINIPLLLAKMSYYGFSASTVKWFHSYLYLRSQIVEVTGLDGKTASSSRIYNLRGVPQGSILGPILFILYSADIITCIKNCQYHIYADDLQLYLHFHPEETDQAVRNVNDDLDRLAIWSEDNCMVLNPTKSKYMVMGSKKQVADIHHRIPQVSILNEPIECVTEARNLGLIMDSQLHFEHHVQEAVRNCLYKLKVLYRVRPYLSVDLRLTLCESLILSKLNYADVVYGPCLLSRTERLIQRVQNACARFCFQVPARAHVTPFLNQANLIKMSARRQLHFATLLFGVIRNQQPEYLFKKLIWAQETRRYEARSSVFVLQTPRHRSASFRGSFRFAASRCWNVIPPPMRSLKTVQAFSRHLKWRMLNDQKV